MKTKLIGVDLMAHPLRLEILRFLITHNTASPKMMADALDVPLGNTSYHCRTMAKMGVIKVARRKQVRGAVEHFYRLNPERTRKVVDELREFATKLEEATNL